MALKPKTKKILLWGGITLGVVIIALYVTVRINKFKQRNQKGQSTAVIEPNINAEETRKGFKTLADESLISIFNSKKDSLAADSLKKDSLQVDSIPIINHTKKVTKETTVKSAPAKNAIAATIQKEEEQAAKKAEPKPKIYSQPKAKTHRENVQFNFTIVKEEEEKSQGNTSSIPEFNNEEEKFELDPTTLSRGRIYGLHMLKNNEPVTLRSIERIKISKKEYIPDGALLYGICRLVGNRMCINITRARTPNGNFPCDLEVYDSYDFQQGIFVKGQNVDVQPEEGISDVTEEVSTAVPNQLIGSTIKSATNLVKRDVKKMKKVTLKVEDNYSVYLQANNLKKK